MDFECSACGRRIGWIEGNFKCPNRHDAIAHCIPDKPVGRKTPPLPNHLRPLDNSELAKPHVRRIKANNTEEIEWQRN